jgi:cytochrome c-type biogenesis protein CcmH/NrfF
MKCHECGTINPDGALFCASCGAKLEEQSSPKHTIDCPICGVENSHNDKYCMACGAELRRHHAKHQVHQSKQNKKREKYRASRFKWTPATIAVVLIGGVLGFIGFMELVVKKEPAPPVPFVETKTNDSKVESKVIDVASKFICSCGTCGEKPLETCTCNTAAEERQFIRNYLQAGQTPEQVIAAVMNTYGWLKPEFAAKYDSTNAIKTRLNTVAATQTQNVFTTLTAKKNADDKIATITDSDEIYSHFRCPCGQCGMDELKDCTCKHPRGATEVKAFVQTKIAEGRYTTAQIMDELEAKYGNRKF